MERKYLLLAIIFIYAYSMANAFYRFPKYEVDSVMAKAIKEHAIDKRTHPSWIECVLDFDGAEDVLGNEMFKVEMTLDVAKGHRLRDFGAYTRIGNTLVYIVDTPYAKRHIEPVSKNINPFFREIYYYPYNSIHKQFKEAGETFYFVIKGDKVEPFAKVRMERVEPVLYRPFTGKAGPIVNVMSKQEKKKK